MPKYWGLKRKRKSSAILFCFKFTVDVLFRQSTIIIGTLPNISPSFVLIYSFHWSGFFHWISGSTSCTITYFADTCRCTTIIFYALSLYLTTKMKITIMSEIQYDTSYLTSNSYPIHYAKALPKKCQSGRKKSTHW